jgi:hypothetical protein
MRVLGGAMIVGNYSFRGLRQAGDLHVGLPAVLAHRVATHLNAMGIPAKLNACSGWNPNGIPG